MRPGSSGLLEPPPGLNQRAINCEDLFVKKRIFKFLEKETSNLEAAGLLKRDLVGEVLPDGFFRTSDGNEIYNLCQNDYLGFEGDPDLLQAQREISNAGFLQTGAPRVAGGTHPLHLELEQWISSLVDLPETVVFQNYLEVTTTLFETLLGAEDGIFYDVLCPPAIKDGIRFSQASAIPFLHNDALFLEDLLKKSAHLRFRAIVVQGVFSLNGAICDLKSFIKLAEQYEALLILDETEGLGVMGTAGRGTRHFLNISSGVDLVIGQLGHLVGSSNGGFVAGTKELISWMRQKSKAYLFHPPLTIQSTQFFIKLVSKLLNSEAKLTLLEKNRVRFGQTLVDQGYNVVGFDHPIIAINTGDVLTTQRLMNALYEKNVSVMGYCYPIVPDNEALIRTQISARFSSSWLEQVLEIFGAVSSLLNKS